MSERDRDRYLALIRGEPTGPLAGFARLLLRLASFPYAAVVSSRNLGYDRGWLKSYPATVPVVAIGNLTLGGTGKTPLVEWVARWYRRHGIRVAILSRGYGQVEGLNDEGRVLSDNLPDVPHLQDADRVRLAAIAVSELETELIVLDDGFQHRRLRRDLDVVLIDALDPFGPGYLFPRGLLREPLSSLRRAGVVVLSRSDMIDRARAAAIRRIAEQAAGKTLEWVEARHAPLDVIDDAGESSPVGELRANSVVAFCGIGNPEGFRRTIDPLCENLADFRIFPDHHNYSADDVAELTRWAVLRGASLVLTTQKDLVKLRTNQLGPIPLRALRIGLEITAGVDIMEDALARLIPGDRPPV